MRSLETLFLLSCVLLVAASPLPAQSNDYPTQYLVNQGYPILPPIIRTPDVSLSENTYTQTEAGQAYWNFMPMLQPLPIQASSTELPGAPATTGIFNSGVTGMFSLNDLHAKRNGFSLGEYAAHLKTHAAPAVRTYTNTDIEHLKGGDTKH